VDAHQRGKSLLKNYKSKLKETLRCVIECVLFEG
jgi:hypothetical protein